MRKNRVIEKLARGELVYGGGLFAPGDPDLTISYAELGYDFLILETEHLGFDARAVRTSIQFLLKSGNPDPLTVPLVRIPPYGFELSANQWFGKHALDQGAFGLVFPRIETVEQALSAVVGSRYPQRTGAAYPEPEGQRGFAGPPPARAWGLSVPDYYACADLWPLDPDGEILLMLIIETAAGVRNLPEILEKVPGIGAVWAGNGDMSLSLGAGPNPADPIVEAGVGDVLAACRRFDVPCCIAVRGAEDLDGRIEQGFRMFFSSARLHDPALEHGRRRSG